MNTELYKLEIHNAIVDGNWDDIYKAFDSAIESVFKESLSQVKAIKKQASLNKVNPDELFNKLCILEKTLTAPVTKGRD